MTTKAFTSALGYGITVRGYIDEEDKLVLLEPEGGGGGGFKAVSVTIRPADDQQTTPTFGIEYIAVEGGDDGEVYQNIAVPTATVTELTAITRSVMQFGSASDYEIAAVSGAEAIEDEEAAFMITGEAVFTYRLSDDASV